jgi:hypothetical protein
MATPTPERVADDLQHGLQNLADYTYLDETQQPGVVYPGQYGSSQAASGLSPSPFYGGESSSAYPEPPQMVSGPSYPYFPRDANVDMDDHDGLAHGNEHDWHEPWYEYLWRSWASQSWHRRLRVRRRRRPRPSPLRLRRSRHIQNHANRFSPWQNSQTYASTPGTTPSSTPQITTRTTRSGQHAIHHQYGGADPLRPRPAGVQKATSSPGASSSRSTTTATTTTTTGAAGSRAASRTSTRTAARKKKKNPNEKPSVDQPLSSLLAHLNGTVHDVDIAAYVHRSVETRRREVDEDKHKKIKRPMNAFMLYRKAFQNRIKSWQTNDNHQGVSKVAGDGWPLESDETHDQFKEWARVERDMHAAAFPDYKFAPTKSRKNGGAGGANRAGSGNGAGGGGSSKNATFSDGDDTDLEDNWSGLTPSGGGSKRGYAHIGMLGGDDLNDPDWRPSGGGRVYSAYHHAAAAARQMSQSPYQSPPPPAVQQQHNMSHYQYSNPNKPLPRPYPLPDQQGFYRQQRVDMSQHPVPGYSPERSIQYQNVYFEDQILPPQHHHHHHQQSAPPQYHHHHPHHHHAVPPQHRRRQQQQQQQHHGLLGSYSPVYKPDDFPSAHTTPMQLPMTMAPPPIPGSQQQHSQYPAPPLPAVPRHGLLMPTDDNNVMAAPPHDSGGVADQYGGDDFRLALQDYAPEYEHPYLGEPVGSGVGGSGPFDTTPSCFEDSFALDPALDMAAAAGGLLDPSLEADLLSGVVGDGGGDAGAAGGEWIGLDLAKDEAVDQILDTQSHAATLTPPDASAS